MSEAATLQGSDNPTAATAGGGLPPHPSGNGGGASAGGGLPPSSPGSSDRRGKRYKGFWEPIYNPADVEAFPEFDWNTQNTKALRHQTCNSDRLKATCVGHDVITIEGVSFSECDFRGDFNGVRIVFKSCTFVKCDVGSSTWHDVKFNKCKFVECSFTIATFSDCKFIECHWSKIGISGTETILNNTYFSKPKEFVEAAWTNTDAELLKQNNTDPVYQKMRLEKSKAKLSKVLLQNAEAGGDDAAYYNAMQCYLCQSIDYKVSEAKHGIFRKENRIRNRTALCVRRLEKSILCASGWINDWGASIAKPAIIGLAMLSMFAAFYWFLGMKATLSESFMASVDVSLLVGYTKHSSTSMPIHEQTLFAFNMLLGLWWYAVFIPTVINRISRTRG